MLAIFILFHPNVNLIEFLIKYFFKYFLHFSFAPSLLYVLLSADYNETRFYRHTGKIFNV